MIDNEYIEKLLNNCKEDSKILYIKRKCKRHKTTDKLSLNEVNYVRKLNDLQELNINTLKNFLYENMVSYSTLNKHTGISRPMMCMILNGSRNCTIFQLNKIIKYLKDNNLNFDWR